MQNETIVEKQRIDKEASVFKKIPAIKVVFAESNEVMRRGVQAFLETEPDIELIGETDSTITAIKLTEELHPGVLLIDPMMSDMSLTEVKHIARRFPKTLIIVYSIDISETWILEALRSGIKGYVLKGSTADELLHAIREVAKGYHYLSRPFLELVIEFCVEKSHSGKSDPRGTLSTREKEVLLMVSRSLTSAEIGERLHISRRTVEKHVEVVRRKLGVVGSKTPLKHYILTLRSAEIRKKSRQLLIS